MLTLSYPVEFTILFEEKIFDCLLPVAAVVLMEEGTGGEPHPVAGVQTPVRVQKQLLEHFHALFPGLPEVSSGEETGNAMASEVVDPALLAKLRHDSVYPGEARPCLGPGCQQGGVVAPRDLYNPVEYGTWYNTLESIHLTTHGVSLHLVEVRCAVADSVEELSPEKLAM